MSQTIFLLASASCLLLALVSEKILTVESRSLNLTPGPRTISKWGNLGQVIRYPFSTIVVNKMGETIRTGLQGNGGDKPHLVFSRVNGAHEIFVKKEFSASRQSSCGMASFRASWTATSGVRLARCGRRCLARLSQAVYVLTGDGSAHTAARGG
ncbi:hypothetical protein B0J12DRAFT_317146 [Macrophomina phaseolina]|uniref:Uncharacterized protein n=1 Tax=Macrophomina phaseolina TaxID=35725 RepID=A0ABQ8FW58_9PEZI|nr:hypothetical protein B0J12DRAFT_317146 [Macrophomina phaseolina]